MHLKQLTFICTFSTFSDRANSFHHSSWYSSLDLLLLTLWIDHEPWFRIWAQTQRPACCRRRRWKGPRGRPYPPLLHQRLCTALCLPKIWPWFQQLRLLARAYHIPPRSAQLRNHRERDLPSGPVLRFRLRRTPFILGVSAPYLDQKFLHSSFMCAFTHALSTFHLCKRFSDWPIFLIWWLKIAN